ARAGCPPLVPRRGPGGGPLPRVRGQPGRHPVGEGRGDVGGRRAQHLSRSRAPPGRRRRRAGQPGGGRAGDRRAAVRAGGLAMTPTPVPAPEPSAGPAGLLLSRDLIFTSKITGTARALGVQVLTAGDRVLAATMIERWHPRVVFVDLGAGDLVSPDAL